MKKSFTAQLAWAFVFLGSLILGLTFVAVSLSRFETIKPLVDSLASDGDVESFTQVFFTQLKLWLGLAGGGLLLISALSLTAREKIQEAIQQAPRILRKAGGLLAKNTRTIWGDIKGLKSDGVYLYALLGLTLIAAVIRLLYLSQPMRYDEAYTFLVFASRPFKFIISNYHLPNNHVFHTLLVGLAYRLLGDQPWIIRLPAFLSGVSLVPAAYLVARMLYDRSTGLLTAALTASASFLVEYSTNARGYTLLSLITLLTFAVGIYLKSHPKNYAGWVGLAILSALGFYTLPIMLYPYGALMLWLFLSALVGDVGGEVRGALLKPLVVSGMAALLLTLLFYEPILRDWGFEALIGKGSFNPQGFDIQEGALVGSLVSTWRSWTRDLPSFIAWILAGGFFLSLWMHKSLSRHRLPLSLVILVWCGGLVILQGVEPWPRIWLFLIPFFFVWASAGLVGLASKLAPDSLRGGTSLAVVGALLVAVVFSWNVYHRGSVLDSGQTGTLKDAEAITLYLEGRLAEGDVVVAAVPSNYPLRYYFQYHHLPEAYLYRPKYGPDFERALIIVNQRHGQNLGEVLKAERINEFVNSAQVEKMAQFDGAALYQYWRPQELP
jgi:hypothetical protein